MGLHIAFGYLALEGARKGRNVQTCPRQEVCAPSRHTAETSKLGDTCYMAFFPDVDVDFLHRFVPLFSPDYQCCSSPFLVRL